MFKFGRPYVFYGDNIVHDYISGVTQNWIGATGATFFMSVDPISQPATNLQEMENLKTYWFGPITKIGSGTRAIGDGNNEVFRWDDEL